MRGASASWTIQAGQSLALTQGKVLVMPNAEPFSEEQLDYLVELLKEKSIKLTRIARGLPAGGGLESADELTLYQALTGRTQL